jgi:hypothetical protein
LPLAYSFRRTNSSSSNSTLTTAKNTTTDHSTIVDSPQPKHENGPSRSSNTNHLPPLPHSNNIFENERGHRRSHSGDSTTSSLSAGGFSLSSYNGPKGKSFIH